MYRGISSAVKLTQLLISESVKSGGTAVDATAGNGYDTVFLTGLVGEHGRVYAIDTQEIAIQNTRACLEERQMLDRVTLIHGGHEKMKDFVKGPVDAVIFNLGYLPGGDHSLKTCASTTITALQSATELLSPRGRIGLVAYTGHPGGREECEAVEKWVSSLEAEKFSVIRIEFLNKKANSPVVIVIERSGDLFES